MTRRCAILLLTLGVVMASATTALARKAHHLSNYDVEMWVDEAGDLRVVETITYEFTRGTFTYAYRKIPVKGFEDIEFLSLTSPDGPVSLTRAARTEGWRNRLDLRWTFPETDRARTFRIEYVARGVLSSRNGRNVLDWQAVGDDWKVAIHDVNVAVHLPWVLGRDVEAKPEAVLRVSDGETALLFHQASLRKEKAFRVVVSFPERVDVPPPVGPSYAGRTLTTLAVGFPLIAVLLFVFWRRVGRVEPRGVPSALTDNPEPGLTAAEAACLARFGINARASVAALVFDLARRGIVKVEAVAKKGVLKTRSFDVTARTLHRPDDLPVWDAKVLGQLERDGNLKKLGRKTRFMSQIVTDVKTALREKRLVSSDREAVRRRWGILSLVVAALTTTFFILVMVNVWRELLAPGILAFVGGIGFVIASAVIETRSAEGMRLSVAFARYARWLKEDIERQLPADPTQAAARFAENLPELIMDAGVDASWIGKLKKKVKGQPFEFSLPGWIEVRDPSGQPLEGIAAAANCFEIFTESVGAVAVYAGGATASGGGGAGGAGGGGGGAG